MGFLSVPYRVYADDTSALGPHQFLTSSRFQTAVWESLLADYVVSEEPAARDEFDRVALLLQEGYNRTLGSVSVGDQVAVLVSFEERGPS
jgi:hypothetical protein